jgi:hypothetical protein
MNVGVTGHQYRPSIDWDWVARTISIELKKLSVIGKIYSSLASGSDQIAADVAIGLAIPVIAVIPFEEYHRFFSGPDLANYRRILAYCEVVQLSWKGDPHRAFFEAGKYIVDNSDTLLAIWDGKGAEGVGETGDVVEYAKQRAEKIIHINPIVQNVIILN